LIAIRSRTADELNAASWSVLVRATGTDDYTASPKLQPLDRLPPYACRMLCPCQQRRVSLLSPPGAPPAVARCAWLFEKVTVVHRTGRNGVRSIARTHSSDQVCAIVPRAKFPSRVLTRRFRFLFYNFPGSDGARFRMVRTGVCRRCGHMGRHYLGASAFLVPRWPHHPEWDRSPVKTTSRRLVVFAIELH
jgi:hypothetical protein